jgi:hypothetical protein
MSHTNTCPSLRSIAGACAYTLTGIPSAGRSDTAGAGLIGPLFGSR